MIKRLLRPALFGATEWLWSLGFSIAGRRARGHLSKWHPIGGGRVLVIAPHPDDESTGCGGTSVLHQRAGDQVSILQVTDGRASRALGLPPEVMAQVRIKEGLAATAALGVSELEQLAWPQNEWSESELQRELRQRLLRLKPDLIYTPSCIDYHPEHLRVARALAAVLESATAPTIRIYEILVPLTLRLANCVADTSEVTSIQDAALATYRSQANTLRPIKRLRRYWASYFHVASSAEVFCELTPRAFCALMQQGDWLGARDWSPEFVPYRSLRLRPFTDPLAFWQGDRERIRLRPPPSMSRARARESRRPRK